MHARIPIASLTDSPTNPLHLPLKGRLPQNWVLTGGHFCRKDHKVLDLKANAASMPKLQRVAMLAVSIKSSSSSASCGSSSV